MNKVLPVILVLLSFLVIRCGDSDGGTYVYSLPEGERFIYGIGSWLLYSCSNGQTDTFLVEDAWLRSNEEESPCGGLFGPGKTCTYKTAECQIYLQQLHHFWPIVLEGMMGNDSPDSTNSYGLRFYGSFDSDNRASDCSSLASEDMSSHYGFIAGYCKEGSEEDTYAFQGVTYSNAFMKEGIYGENPKEPETHFRIYWNLKYGIFRYEDLRSDPPITWDLAGKIN